MSLTRSKSAYIQLDKRAIQCTSAYEKYLIENSTYLQDINMFTKLFPQVHVSCRKIEPTYTVAPCKWLPSVQTDYEYQGHTARHRTCKGPLARNPCQQSKACFTTSQRAPPGSRSGVRSSSCRVAPPRHLLAASRGPQPLPSPAVHSSRLRIAQTSGSEGLT